MLKDKWFNYKQKYILKRNQVKEYIKTIKGKIYKSPFPSIVVDIIFTGFIFSIVMLCLKVKILYGFGIAIIAWYIQYYIEWIIKLIQKR